MQRIVNHLITGFSLILILLSAACADGNQIINGSDATPTPIPTPMVASKPTYTVKRGDIVSILQFNGRVVPVQEEPLFFRADGRIRTVYVKPGELITSGQVIADLVSLDELEKSRQQDQLNLRKAEINLEMARLRQTITATSTPWYTSNYEEQMAMKAYEVELAQIALQEQQLSSSRLDNNIQDAQVIAPFDGRLLTSNLQSGAVVKAFEAVAIVGDDTQLEIGAKLISTQMELLSESMACAISFVNRSGDVMQGQIRLLPYPYGSSGQKDSSGVTGVLSTTDTNTRISIILPDGATLKTSDMVSITVILDSKNGVLWLPPSAIRSFEGRNFVVVQSDDAAPRRVDIKTGLSNDDMVEVVEGLEEGQVVVAP